MMLAKTASWTSVIMAYFGVRQRERVANKTRQTNTETEQKEEKNKNRMSECVIRNQT